MIGMACAVSQVAQTKDQHGRGCADATTIHGKRNLHSHVAVSQPAQKKYVRAGCAAATTIHGEITDKAQGPMAHAVSQVAQTKDQHGLGCAESTGIYSERTLHSHNAVCQPAQTKYVPAGCADATTIHGETNQHPEPA